MLEIPVYLITGFLESGKTTFIREVLASPDFADGARTLLITCEEGEEEYDLKDYARHNIDVVSIEEEADLNPKKLEQLQKYYKPQRIFVEFNGTWDAQKFADESLPKRWEIVQVITLVDGSTFDMFLSNMRNFLSNIFMMTEVVVFNRCSMDMDLQKYRRAVKAINPQAMLSFEDEEGNQLDIGQAQPPYDVNAEIIDIQDVDWGIWYMDMTDNPDRYKGKTVRFLSKVMIPRKFPDNAFIPGRNAMTCCANDIRFIGYICKSQNVSKLKQKQWLEVTAEVRYEKMKEYSGEEGPVLYAKHLKTVEAPADEVVYFN